MESGTRPHEIAIFLAQGPPSRVLSDLRQIGTTQDRLPSSLLSHNYGLEEGQVLLRGVIPAGEDTGPLSDDFE